MAAQITQINCNVPVPTNAQELEQAIWQYRTGEFQGADLFCRWQAIRDAALAQRLPEPEGDRVSVEDSY
ncbi:MAG TPA: hypothetical protein V6C88_20600 [Chroococcidiopsis sp.]